MICREIDGNDKDGISEIRWIDLRAEREQARPDQYGGWK